MVIKINGMEQVASSYKVVDALNPIKDIKEFFEPMVSFFRWCGNVIGEIRESGFWNWLGEQLMFLMQELFHGILSLNDLLFLIPAVVLLMLYFFIGKNRTTKFIVPLWVGYFMTEIWDKIYY